jgi:excisionase family DNA binding protein
MAQLLTIRQVARLLSVTPRTIRTYVASGDLPAVRIGGKHLRIAEDVLDAFLRANATEANS